MVEAASVGKRNEMERASNRFFPLRADGIKS